MGNRIFQNIPTSHVPRSAFDLSYSKLLTGDMGKLYPVMADMVLPGDAFSIGNQFVIRFMPMVTPLLHEVNVYVHYFFVPLRLLWPTTKNAGVPTDGWEPYITGGRDGTFTATLPRWTPVDSSVGSLWDYLGFPTGIVPTGTLPVKFPMRAYNMIFNNFYRDPNLTDEIDQDTEVIQSRCWEKDYFTSALLTPQRGTAPALPITGTTSADFTNAVGTGTGLGDVGMILTGGNARLGVGTGGSFSAAQIAGALNQNTIDLSSATTFNVNDLRLAFQMQKFLERSARSGTRYVEFLQSFFNVFPRDDRLQRPEYIGGTKSPLITSEVLQTSQSDTTPQGTMAGHGIALNDAFAGKYHVKEFGVIMGLMSVMPRTVYEQGIDRQWLLPTNSRYDFYNPLFAHLGEQLIQQVEIFATDGNASENVKGFGYQGRWDEHRCKRNMSVGRMRNDATFDPWTISRQFVAAPQLNSTFTTCTPRKDFLAVPAEPTFVCSFGNIIKALRPLPVLAEPGLIDH